jgi:hypothetical protein
VTVDDFLPRLEAVRRSARGFLARCPAHADRHPSLSVSEGERGILVKCWTGCTVEEITAALGLTLSDLFYDVIASHEPRPAHPRLSRFDWRRTASDFLHHAEGLRHRAERVLEAARGLDLSAWSEQDHDAAMNAVCRAYGGLEWAGALENVAFDLRQRGIREEKERYASRRRTTIEAA